MVDVSLLFIDFLAAEEVVTEPEAVLLRGTLRAPVPIVKSRYCTEEVQKRPIERRLKAIWR